MKRFIQHYFCRATNSTVVEHSWTAVWNTTDTAHIANVDLSHSICLLNRFRMWNVSIKARQIGPGCVELMMNTNYGPMVCLQTVTPVEPMVQKVVHRFYRCEYFFAIS